MIKHEDIDDGKCYQKSHKICCDDEICCTLACNLLWGPCRKAVSGKKVRFVKDGFNLDLAYITPNIIVHGFPAMGLEHVYRNPRHEIRRFMDNYHKNHYKMFNFCCEPGRGYDPKFFHNVVERYPFKDHNVPPLETMAAFCNSAKLFLDADESNVCNMHCKAGKGRAGLMSCLLLIRNGDADSAENAIKLYDSKRVTNMKGLTVTSQRKMVLFYELLWRNHWKISGNIGDVPGEVTPTNFKVPEQPDVHVVRVQLVNVNTDKLKSFSVKIYKGTNFSPILVYDSKSSSDKNLSLDCDCFIQGNFKVLIEQKKGIFGGKKKVFELWHNTLFMDVNATYIDFGLDQLDIKKGVKKTIGDSAVLRMVLKDDAPVGATQPKGYSVVSTADDSSTKDVELTKI
jgi:hypothetical protein